MGSEGSCEVGGVGMEVVGMCGRVVGNLESEIIQS